MLEAINPIRLPSGITRSCKPVNRKAANKIANVPVSCAVILCHLFFMKLSGIATQKHRKLKAVMMVAILANRNPPLWTPEGVLIL